MSEHEFHSPNEGSPHHGLLLFTPEEKHPEEVAGAVSRSSRRHMFDVAEEPSRLLTNNDAPVPFSWTLPLDLQTPVGKASLGGRPASRVSTEAGRGGVRLSSRRSRDSDVAMAGVREEQELEVDERGGRGDGAIEVHGLCGGIDESMSVLAPIGVKGSPLEMGEGPDRLVDRRNCTPLPWSWTLPLGLESPGSSPRRAGMREMGGKSR
eukprot:CAMPEP_0170263602 /NCGR_PEP_ID=MMETSP0116_2-20130129/31689_1 /TAXON_ID=400756 /ORGANISM="Durinskia baltica, Strain CSIRO CS-38" /LENGTH=207 /DNA_ID=CAMNT_0010514681 /DNA_START=23 /DNA_END=643 /DNA_ORIENTATION=-